MGDYASKGLANGLGIPALVTGGLALLNSANCGNGGLLGGLLGGGNCNARMGAELQYVSELQAKVGRLEAEKYSDINDKAIYQQTLQDNSKLRDEFFAFVKPIADEAANNRVEVARLQEKLKCLDEKNELQAQITAGKINETALAFNGKLDTMHANYQGAFNSLNATIACISNTVNNITKTIVPLCAVCPQPMQRFNTFATPTAQAPDCGTCATGGTA